MIKLLKKLINVLWAIEKDLSVIASNTEALRMKYVGCDDPGPKGQLGHPDVGKAEVQPPYVTNAQFSFQRKNPNA